LLTLPKIAGLLKVLGCGVNFTPLNVRLVHQMYACPKGLFWRVTSRLVDLKFVFIFYYEHIGADAHWRQ